LRCLFKIQLRQKKKKRTTAVIFQEINFEAFTDLNFAWQTHKKKIEAKSKRLYKKNKMSHHWKIDLH
jgi:hypothetical protein